MGFRDFTDKEAYVVGKKLGEGYQTALREVEKNNHVMLTGLLISEGESNVSPAIYLEPFYQAVAENTMTFEEAVSEIMKIYKENRIHRNFDTSSFTEYGKVKDRLRIKLVNTEKNKDFLLTVPNRSFWICHWFIWLTLAVGMEDMDASR